MSINEDDSVFTFLAGIEIRLHSDICFDLLRTIPTTLIPISTTILTTTYSTLVMNTVVTEIPVLAYICSICIPVIFIIAVILLWYYFKR